MCSWWYIQDILDEQSPIEIGFQYVPGHIGLPGNEEADKLARQGSTLPPQPSACSIGTAKLILRENLRAKWTTEYNEFRSESADRYRQMRPTIASKDYLNLSCLDRATTVTIARLRLDRFATNSYLHRCQRLDDPNCECGDIETADHMLVLCRMPYRIRLRHQIFGSNPPNTVREMLFGPEEVLKKSAKYALEAVRRRQ